MIQMNSEQFGILAEGWFELIPFLAIVIISVASSIVKAMGNRSGDSENADDKTKRLIEMAKRRKAMQESGRDVSVPKETVPYARTERTTERKPTAMSEWDRRQQEKKRETEQRRSQPDRLRYVSSERPKPRPVQPAEEIPVAKAVQQPEPVRPVFKPPKIVQKPRPKRASQPIQKRPIRRATEIPTATAVPRQKQPAARVKHAKKSPKAGQSTFKSLLKQKDSIRSAIVLKEILDKPIGLREGW